MTENASRFVGTIPQNYDEGLGPRIFFDYADELAQRVAGYKPDSVLELAAGTGIVTRRLRDALPGVSRIVATDLNAPMLDVARSKFNPGESVEFDTANACSLKFDDEAFDLVACQFGVMFFPDKVQSFSECLRVLRPGGHYLFNVWGPWEKNTYARLVHETVARFFPDDPPGFYRVPFSYHDKDEIRSALGASGFGNIVIDDVDLVSEIPSADAFARGAIYGNPIYDEIVSRGGDPSDVFEAVKSAIADELGESPNGVRMILTKAEVYIKKAPAAGSSAPKSGGGTRVSKAAAVEALAAALSDAGQEVDEDIVNKLTGKAAQYFTTIITALNT